MTQSDKSVLQAQIKHLEQISVQAPSDEHELFRLGREGRIASLKAEVASLEEAAPAPSVLITFNGSSVNGSESMGVKLITKTMSAFKDMVGLIAGSVEGLSLSPTGKARSAKVDDLHFTSVALGSFGYELAVRKSGEMYKFIETGQAIDEALSILEFAGTDEEAFLSAVDELPVQLFAKLKAFVGPVKQDKGTIRLVTQTRELDLSKDEVVLAYDRITSTVKEDYTDTFSGTFQGVLTGSREFEFKPDGGDSFKGRVEDELEDERLEEFDRKYVNKEVRATFKVVVVKPRGGAERKSFTLLDVR